MAGRGQKDGETRLDLIKANSGILKSVIDGMRPIKPSAKMIIVSNPCDALAYVAQEHAGLPMSQVFGSGTVLDSKRLQVALAKKVGVSSQSVTLYVLGEHGDSQFPAASLANIGGIPLLEAECMQNVDLYDESKKSAQKAYSIISKKGYTAIGVGRAVEDIVDCVLKDRRMTLPVSVRVPGKNCCLSLPCVVGWSGVERILEHVTEHLSDAEISLYHSSIRAMQAAVGSPVDPEPTVVRAEGGAQPSLTIKDLQEDVKQVASKGGGGVSMSSLVVPEVNRTKALHVAIVGAGFVGTCTAMALLCAEAVAKVTLTDVNAEKCDGEVRALEDGNGRIEMALPAQAGQADIMVITAGRGQRDGETRLDLIKANAAIMKSVIDGMQPIKSTAKIIVVSNPCDALTYVAQEVSGLPHAQVFGSGTVLDTRRLRISLGEHGDSQFPVASLTNVGGVPLLKCKHMEGVNLAEEAKQSATKAYSIIGKKGYTAFGVARAVQTIIEAVADNQEKVMPVSVRVPGKQCCLSLPCVVGSDGVHRILENVTNHFSTEERAMYEGSIQGMETAVAAVKEALTTSEQP